MVEYYVLTPHMLGQYVRNTRWGIEAYYRKLYGKQAPKTKEMDEGTRLHEEYGYTNEEKFVKKFELEPGVWVELRGKPDRIDEYGRPYEAKTLEGTYVPKDKYEGAKVQLLCYLFLMDQPIGFLDFISRKTGKRLSGFPRPVHRDDRYLFEIMKNFIKELKSQRQIVPATGR